MLMQEKSLALYASTVLPGEPVFRWLASSRTNPGSVPCSRSCTLQRSLPSQRGSYAAVIESEAVILFLTDNGPC
jgi:hypothetical protein